MSLARISKAVIKELAPLRFSAPVTHVYNPLDYAWRAHARYLEKYSVEPRPYLLLGMNPGPYGMTQTGVPFGEVAAVRDWLDIEETVRKPRHEHPKRHSRRPPRAGDRSSLECFRTGPDLPRRTLPASADRPRGHAPNPPARVSLAPSSWKKIRR